MKAAQREAETAYRWHVAAMIEEAFQALPESQKEAVLSKFTAGLTSTIYSSAFQKGGWKDRLTFPESKKFWEARGLVLPSPADFAKEKGSKEPDAIKARIAELEAELK
jgi:hypothetical protein